MTSKLKINLYGEAWSLKRVELGPIQQEYFSQVANRTNQPLSESLIDPFFYPKLRLGNIQSHDDLKGESIMGLINTPKNQIEIWYQGKRLNRFKITDLSTDFTLFQVYNNSVTEIEPVAEPGIYIEIWEFGLIGTYEVMLNNFTESKLYFHLKKYQNQLLLSKISYDNKLLRLIKKDTLINRQNSYEILP